MIKYIKAYLYKLLKPQDSTDEILDDPDADNDTNPYIQFTLNDNNSIEISCGIEQTDNLNSDSIIELSEQYAELLLGISNSLLKNSIIETLKKESKKTEDHQKILLIDNIISFYETLQKERLKSSAFYHLPVVLPSLAFRENQS